MVHECACAVTAVHVCVCGVQDKATGKDVVAHVAVTSPTDGLVTAHVPAPTVSYALIAACLQGLIGVCLKGSYEYVLRARACARRKLHRGMTEQSYALLLSCFTSLMLYFSLALLLSL